MRLPTRLLQRSPDGHKGNYGHIFVLAGSLKFSGAALLCVEGALRSGAGLVTLGMPKGLSNPVIRIKPKEVMLLPLPQTQEGTLSRAGFKQAAAFMQKADLVVIGPGLSLNLQTQELIRRIISIADLPVVIDADGLNALAGYLQTLSGAGRGIKILTPHPGEMSRLLGVSIDEVESKRKEVAKTFASDYNVVVVLKGHRTVVASPGGEIYLNNTGNPGMATAGSGDVLSGMIASFLGQGLDAFRAAKYAVYLHGLAGDLAAKEKTQLGMIASDIIDYIPKAIKLSS